MVFPRDHKDGWILNVRMMPNSKRGKTVLDYLELLARLVNIDSGTGDTEGIAQIAEIIGPRLKRLGLIFEPIVAEDGSVHYHTQRGEGKKVLLLAHLDTVFPKGTAAVRSFHIDGDLAFGPGVSDCKSGVVTIIGALEELSKNSWPSLQINCLFNSDEENSSPGSRGIIQRLARDAAAVLVVEPAEGENITVARKGIGRFTLRVFGRAAHSGSNYAEGCNAILEMAHKIIAIQGLSKISEGITLNVGTVNGGVRPNIVPDFAVAEIDLRLTRPEQAEPLIKELERIAGSCTVPGTSARLSGGITRPPMPLNEINLKLYESILQVGRGLGVELGAFQSGGGSDANLAAALGVPTVDGMGPMGGGHHSETEFMNIPSLFRRIELLTNWLRILPGL